MARSSVCEPHRFDPVEVGTPTSSMSRVLSAAPEMGLPETKCSVASKLSRGGFSAVFFIAAMKAIGRETIDLEDPLAPKNGA